jgi:hypothetical protein
MKSSIELIDFSETHAAGSLCLTSVFQRQKWSGNHTLDNFDKLIGRYNGQ